MALPGLTLTQGQIYSKYLTLENKNLQDLVKKFGIDADEAGIPNKILTNKDLEEALTIKEEDIAKIAEKYRKVIMDNIASEDVEVDKDATVKLNFNGEEKTLKSTKYTVEINEKEALEMLIDVLKELKDDEDTFKLVEENFNAMVKLYEDNGYDMDAAEFDVDEIKEALDEVITDLEDELEYYKDEKESDLESAEICIYVHKGETIKTSLERDGMEIALVSYGESDEEVIDFYAAQGEEKVGINAYQKTTKSGDTINYDGFMAIYANIEGLPEKINVKLNVNEEIEFKDVEIVEFDSNNSLNINNASEAELQTMIEDVTKGAQAYLLKLMGEFYDVVEKIMSTAEQINTVEEDFNTTDVTTLDEVEQYEQKVDDLQNRIDDLEAQIEAEIDLYNTKY